ncbi:type III-B CRISPR module-associated protein Cmr3, partial [Mesorhizobium sp. M0621]|uniref:hypothetical protein n=1 Tax=Mesorhizobium sp. M0621 TaxID=2956974 RepID=UPI003336B22D
MATAFARTFDASGWEVKSQRPKETTRKERGMVYFLSAKEGEVYSYGMKALDGDLNKIQPVDLSQDGGVRIPGQSLRVNGRCVWDANVIHEGLRDLRSPRCR